MTGRDGCRDQKEDYFKRLLVQFFRSPWGDLIRSRLNNKQIRLLPGCKDTDKDPDRQVR
jgi:hypothetical protein